LIFLFVALLFIGFILLMKRRSLKLN